MNIDEIQIEQRQMAYDLLTRGDAGESLWMLYMMEGHRHA